jgi:bud site selection protein 31
MLSFAKRKLSPVFLCAFAPCCPRSRRRRCCVLLIAVDDPHDGKRKCESEWDIHRIHWKKNRFIYEMYYKDKKISKECYDWLCRLKIADQPLISKWRKPGYEILCSMLAISQSSTNFGTVSVCRVPMRQRGGGIMPAVKTGCVSCASGDSIDGGPIWWCDKRPIMANAHEHREDSRPAKRQKGDEDGGAGAGDAAGTAAVVQPEEPKLDDAVLARLAALKGDAAATD